MDNSNPNNVQHVPDVSALTEHERMTRLEDVVSKLAHEVRSLRDNFSSRPREYSSASDVLSIVSPEDMETPEAPPVPVPGPARDISFKLETTLKSSGAITSKEHAEILDKLQHFNSNNWSQVRYIDAQNTYVSSPGFTDLESNDMIKSFDRNRALAVTEKTLAAVSHALIIQNEKLKAGFETFVSWIGSQGDCTVEAVADKINEVFSEGDYSRIHLDLLQMVCGRRADIIQQRRDGVLHFVKDRYMKESLRKIPPTQEHLFDDKRFSDCITKNGGIDKVFFCPRTPAQGVASKRTPAQGVSQPEQSKKAADYPSFRVYPGPSAAPAQASQDRKRKAGPFRSNQRSDKYYKNKQGKRSRRRYD
ncbi:uncharacterized protein LOC133534041 [Cydia pomonella]|uniref:uncharacterized protein LOC133534041 n=1 Tax=Cydia pomonella TaxID=82600 RepID=UPI002ADDE91A|nr:uncharacterized protein LOC133534041 [Cydia pomonella]